MTTRLINDQWDGTRQKMAQLLTKDCPTPGYVWVRCDMLTVRDREGNFACGDWLVSWALHHFVTHEGRRFAGITVKTFNRALPRDPLDEYDESQMGRPDRKETRTWT